MHSQDIYSIWQPLLRYDWLETTSNHNIRSSHCREAKISNTAEIQEDLTSFLSVHVVKLRCWDFKYSLSSYWKQFYFYPILTNRSFYSLILTKQRNRYWPVSIMTPPKPWGLWTIDTLTASSSANWHQHFSHNPSRTENSKDSHCSKLTLLVITADKDQCQMMNVTLLQKTNVPKLTPDSLEGHRAALGLWFPPLHNLQGQVIHVTLMWNTRSSSRKVCRAVQKCNTI